MAAVNTSYAPCVLHAVVLCVLLEFRGGFKLRAGALSAEEPPLILISRSILPNSNFREIHYFYAFSSMCIIYN